MITVVAVGKLKDLPLNTLIATYEKRLHTPLTWIEIPHGTSNDPIMIKKQEGATIEKYLKKIKAHSFIIGLDETGATITSEAFSKLVDNCWQNTKKLVFVIGGAEGISHDFWTYADYKLSLGAMTWPHMFVRLMLVEQIYRAQQILKGHPYHRA